MSTIKTETLSTPSNATVPVDTVVNGTAKAWVNFNGTGTVAIRRAFNVASITDNATGVYTVNFTTAMEDNNYSVVAFRYYGENDNGKYGMILSDYINGDSTSSSCKLRIFNPGVDYYDSNSINATFFS